jgi:hypothetical protein
MTQVMRDGLGAAKPHRAAAAGASARIGEDPAA